MMMYYRITRNAAHQWENHHHHENQVTQKIRCRSQRMQGQRQRRPTLKHHEMKQCTVIIAAFPSCVETLPKQDTKKYSADSYMTRNTDDRHSKRASSESKDKITKRNVSSPAAISLLGAAGNEKNQRLSSDDRGKMPPKQTTLPLKASPELLAELLRGSSEKMTTAERERNKKLVHVDAYVLPMAVQQFLVSVCVIFTILHIVWNSIRFACTRISRTKSPKHTKHG